MLPPVVENGVLLGHLPLHTLPIVHVEDDEGGGQGGQDHQQRHSDGENVGKIRASTFIY